MSDLETILSKWNDDKKKLEILESRINKYKVKITKEMKNVNVF